MAIRMTCPHCGALAVARTSSQLTRTSRDLLYQCTNVACGHTFRAVLEITYTISPPAVPNPAVHLPLSKSVRRNALRELLDSASTRTPPAGASDAPGPGADTSGDLFAPTDAQEVPRPAH